MYCLRPLSPKLHRLRCSSKCGFWSRIKFWILVPSLITWLTLKFREVKLLLIFCRYKPKVISMLLSLCENCMIKYKVKVRHMVNKLSIIGVVFKIVFVKSISHLTFGPFLLYRFYALVSGFCLTPASLVKGSGSSCRILLSSVNYPLHFSSRWISGWRSATISFLSPLPPFSLSLSLLSPPSFIFHPSLLQKCWHLHLCAVWKASEDWGISRCRKWERKFWWRNWLILNRNGCDIQELSARWQVVKTIYT